jgi:hypothetical protein
MEQKPVETKEKKKGGRPMGYSPKTETKGMKISVEGDEVVIRIPKKDLSRKLLADLI